jgi:hypothetical protein
MSGGLRVHVGEHRTERLNANVLGDVLENFRRAVHLRHGTTYDKMHHEVNRALKAHTDTLLLEVRAFGQGEPPSKKDAKSSDDPFMNCLHANIKEEGGDDPSSDIEPRVL